MGSDYCGRDAKICIDSLMAISLKGKQVHRSISTLIRNSLEISKNFLSYKFCWISRDCNGAAHASVKLAGSLLEGPFLVITITSVLVMLIFAGSIVLILFLRFFFFFNESPDYQKKKTWILVDDAWKINREVCGKHAIQRHLHNTKREDLTESTGVVPAEYPPKVKLELLTTLEC